MSDQSGKICPTCNGAKVIPGTCVCNSEWRGNEIGDSWDECRCEKEVQCPTCGGTGYISDN